MGTLNPDLIGKDLDAVLNDAVALKDEFRKPAVMPEMVLLALLRRKETAAARILGVFASSRGVDVQRLERQVYLACERARDQNGSLDFVAAGNRNIPLSRQTIILVDDALSEANAREEVRVDTDHALLVLAESSQTTTSGILRQHGITPKALTDIMGDKQQYGGKPSSSTAQDIVATAKAGELRAVYFREDLLREMINILTQSINRHIILVGPDGVGKRTLAYSLGLLISEGKGPNGITSLVQIDETALLDNDHQAMRAGLSKARGGILFIPHLHRFFGGPVKADFTKSTPQVQKAFLEDDPIIIATTTDVEYNQRLAGVMAVAENSQILRVPEPSVEETIEILRILKPHLEADYQLQIADEALLLTARLAKRYLGGTPLPRSAERLLHRTAAMVNMSKQTHLAFKPDIKNHSELDAEDITLTASQMTGVPVSKLGEDERMRYASMVEHLKERLIGQDEAVLAVSRAIKTARVGLKDPRRPIGAFLFLGPTGVGKTELARALAEFMFGNEEAMLPLDMSEFQDDSSLNRLIGSPTGYVGSEEGGQLTERVRQQPYTIVLFDEVEKAHPRVLDILLQMIEEGRLTDGRGNTTRFTETVIILTSNLGSQHLAVPVITDEVRDEAMDQVRDFFRPEFLNRLDEVIMFSALTNEDLYDILKLMLKKEGKMAQDRGLALDFSEEAVQWLLAQNDQPEYGARPLQRLIRRFVREPLADFLLRANPPAGTQVRIDADGSGLTFAAVAEDGKAYTVEG
ncbi:MAG: ATP-dependent Clp protease ATP-binding subunit [Anaerolineae bacterium]|nr:ATP-dependent Clp protease ATP-binding subunit [Anaerolineae bacterium]